MAMASPWENTQPGSHVQRVLSHTVQHPAPGRNVGRNAHPQEAKGCLHNNGPSQRDAGQYDERGGAVGRHMAQNDPPVAGSHGARRQDVVHLFDAERLRTYRTGRPRYEHSAQSNHHIGNRSTENGHDRQRQDQSRERHHGIHHALNCQIGDSTEVPTNNANERTDSDAETYAQQPNHKRNARTVHQTTKHVPTDLVTAQPGFPAGRTEALRSVSQSGVVGGDYRS